MGPRGQPGVNPYRDCAEIVRKSYNVSAVAVQSPHPPHGNRTEPVRGSAPCGDCAMPPTTCLRATGLRFFKFVKLLAKPNRRGRGARESVRKSHSCLLPPQGGLAEAARKGGYGQDTGSVDPSQAKCELGIDGKIVGGIPKMLVFCNFLQILMVSDKMIHKAFRIHKTYLKQNPLGFYYLPQLYIGFKFCTA